ncbi:hypothetical protein Pelo_8786 [Pelomyxa schiedti]|nr:hypothetical protein Pelo_8786 [Pelomyxa schiedti]
MSLQETLCCKLCFESFALDLREPRALECMHSFCTPCLQVLVDQAVKEAKTELLCPLDRSPSSLPKDNLATNYKKNYSLLEVISSLLEEKTTPTSPTSQHTTTSASVTSSAAKLTPTIASSSLAATPTAMPVISLHAFSFLSNTFCRTLLLAVQQLHRSAFLFPPHISLTSGDSVWTLELGGESHVFRYDSSEGSALRSLAPTATDLSALSPRDIANFIIAQRATQLALAKPSLPLPKESYLKLWWFDRVLEDTAPQGIYWDTASNGTFGVAAPPPSGGSIGTATALNIPSFAEVAAYSAIHSGELHPFLLRRCQLPAQPDLATKVAILKQASRDYEWTKVLEIIQQNPRLFANSVHPQSKSGYAPLHQACYGGAPPEVLRALIALGADPFKRCCDGTPLEIAFSRKKLMTYQILENLAKNLT